MADISENYIKQLHKILLQYSSKDERHKGEYKKVSNAVAAYSPDGKELGIVFETATPFETPWAIKGFTSALVSLGFKIAFGFGFVIV